MPINSSTETWSGLKCRTFDAIPESESPQKLLILCHGFGAPGDDLAAFGPHLIESSDVVASTCRLIFPEAPIDLTPMGMPGGRAWWQINMAQLAAMHQTRDFEKLTTLEPPGMAEASEQLAAAVREMQAEHKLNDSEIILGGFSQGAMICANLVLQHGFAPDLLVLFSGSLLWRDTWTESAAAHAGCRVLQSHGKQDMILPFSSAEALRDVLSQNGFPVTFRAFNGPHTIPPQILGELIEMLE